MDRDFYQVEVLYYLNPHLIWVEVGDKNRQDFVFEQIGVYGILPFETTIDGEGKGLKAQRCEDWVGAASVLMKKSFLDAKEVWFRPTHIDRRTSIFDDNIHKYGEIIIKTHDNKQKALSEILTKSGFALLDVCLFHQELSLGNLKTKLNHANTLDIIKQLEKDTRPSSKKHRQSSVKKQTTVFHAANSLGSTLTQTNLRKHDNLISAKIDQMLEKKSKDFDKCKDVDEEAIGRGSLVRGMSREKHRPSNNSVTQEAHKLPLFLKKKLELTKRQPAKAHDPLQVLLATKKYLEANAKVIHTDSSKSENTEPNCKEEKQPVDLNKLNKNTHLDNDQDMTMNQSDIVDCSMKRNESILSENAFKNMEYRKQDDDSFSDVKINDIKLTNKRSSHRRAKKPKNKIPEYNTATESRVAYGPPGVDSSRLPLKIVSKLTDEHEVEPVSQVNDDFKELKSQEMYAEVDSNVNIEITNKDALRDKYNATKQSDDNKSHISNNRNENSIELTANDSFFSEESLTNSAVSISKLSVLQKKLKLLKTNDKSESSMTSNSDTTNKDSSSDDVAPKKNKKLDSDEEEDISDLVEKINLEYKPKSIKSEMEKRVKSVKVTETDVKNNVNPFKNIDSSLSVFVDKLITPVLMVHNKMNYPIEPLSNIRDVNFNSHIHGVLKMLDVERPMMLQMVSWPVILRGYSLFMIGPLGSGKTFGYLPAVCRLIMDDSRSEFVDSVGPTCIIVCATAQSVSEVEHYARMLMGVNERVVSCFAGVDELKLTTSLLNGCDLFICTPSVLVRLLQLTDFGVDLRRLATFILEDCERLSEVYKSEVKYFLIKIREMLKSRVNKELKVQFIVASRVWCDFMEPLAKRTPNTVVCIGAFQECVLYSKANTTVEFLKKENKINKVLEFLSQVDATKKTVIVCRSNDEVDELAEVLTKFKYVVIACNDTMTVEKLYNLSQALEYQEPGLAPILVCCDDNLNHLNVSDAHNLIHYSLPHLFSMFCKRFSVLNDNYSSIFKEKNEDVRIKVFIEESNTEQLPKILNFVRRCTDQVPEFLHEICKNVLREKDMMKAKKFVPICDNLLALGDCPDFWNCQQRHSIFKEHDEPKDWMPRNGLVTFKILHYHTPVLYSVRLLSNISNGSTKKFPQAYSTLSLKLGMYFSKENNKKLHGIPKEGDVCAVSVKQNFFVRCRVLKILTKYNNGTPNSVLVKLIDEEKLEKTRDIYLFHLPEELKKIETHIVQVRLANVCPKDKDVTYSDLARDMLRNMTSDDEDLYVRGQIVFTVGNCIFVDTLEACQELSSLNETVVMNNLKKELLSTHAIVNPEHIVKLEKLCEKIVFEDRQENIAPQTAPITIEQEILKPQWAHLDDSDMSSVFFTSAESPNMFFVRLVKFESCMGLLLKDIAKYVKSGPEPLERVSVGDVVLAIFPDDAMYERARIDGIINESLVKCFYVDQGDWRDVQIKDLVRIPKRFVSKIPFQAIECRLIGVQPAGEEWTEFGTNWFYDNCFDSNGDPKMLYVKYFTKEHPQHTGGRKYSVAMIDTNTDQDVVLNQLMIDLNLAQEKDDEIAYLHELDFTKPKDSADYSTEENSSGEELDDLPKPAVQPSNSLVPVNSRQEETPRVAPSNIFMKQPIRSVPLVDSDNESADSWDIVNPKDLVAILKGATAGNVGQPKQNEENNENQNISLAKNSSESNYVHDLTPKQSTETVTEPPANILKNQDIKLQNNTHMLNLNSLNEKEKHATEQLDSDDLSSTESSQFSGQSVKLPEITIQNKDDGLRKPKLLWRQNKATVSIKIQLIGVEHYNLELNGRCLSFDALCNDVKYAFEFDLYGVVDDTTHSDKGQYILVKLNKVMKKNWLTLTRDGCIRKWIVYDVDSIDTSSEEEEEAENPLIQAVSKDMYDEECDDESDEDFLDDVNYEYDHDLNK